MSPIPESFADDFTETDERGALYAASLQLALYAKKPLPELAPGATSCYRLFIEKFGAELDWYLARSMRSAREFSTRYAEIFPTLCSEDERGLPSYRVFHGSGLQDYRPPAFATGSYDGFSWLQLHMPPSLANEWEALLSLLTACAQAFPFRCGHVGLSLCWNEVSVERDIEVPRLIGPLLKRYAGLSLGTAAELCDQDLPPVNWLTLIGPELLEQLGGIERVSADLRDEAISVLPMGDGICIKAGPFPRLGDRNRQEDLPLYRKVGSYLREYRGDQEIELNGLDEDDESEAWLARFDS